MVTGIMAIMVPLNKDVSPLITRAMIKQWADDMMLTVSTIF